MKQHILIAILAIFTAFSLSAQVINNPSGNTSNNLYSTSICYVNAAPTWNPDVSAASKWCKIAYNEATGEVWYWQTNKVATGNGAWVSASAVTRMASNSAPSHTPPNPAEIVILPNGTLYTWNGSAWATVGGSGSTNLTTTPSSTTVTVNSDTGTDAIIPAATTSNAGVMTATDKTNLNSVVTNSHVPVTVTDGSKIDFTLTGQDMTATIIPASIANTDLAASGASSGQVLKFNGTNWVPAADNVGSVGSTNLTGGTQIAITNGTGAVIGSSPVTLALAQNGATIDQAMVWNGATWGPGSIDATAIPYAPTTPLTSTDVQGALDELALNSHVPVTAGTTSDILISVATGQVVSATLKQQGASSGQVLKWNGTAWLPAADATGSASEPSGQIVYGTGSGITSGSGFMIALDTMVTQNIKFPKTTASKGILYSWNDPVLHFYGGNEDSTASNNIFMGGAGNFTMNSGHAKYMGKKNIILGAGSGAAITTGYLNTIIGWESIKNCTSCAGTIAVGGHVLENLTTSHDNIGIGDDALRALTTGPENTSVGYSSLISLTSGTHNTALGYAAGVSLLTGDNNTFIGNTANTSKFSGLTNSTAIGSGASVTKSNQIVLGNAAIKQFYIAGLMDLVDTLQNTSVGSGAGTSLAGGIGNTFIGRGANVTGGIGATITNSTAIGAGSSVTKNNQIVLGSSGVTEVKTFGQIVAGSVGGNIRLSSSSGTTANDGFLGVGGANNVILSNYDVNRGIDIKSTGIIEQLGTAAFKLASGTTAQRPTVANGQIRNNTTTGQIEGVRNGSTFESFVMGSVPTTLLITGGAGSPESVVTAAVGSFYLRTDGGAGTTFYVKESGTGNTGWVAK